ncbi:MAG: aminotransferase class I/II-fold pyridoxal phosphate-dependent enzyme, partial [Planctomycetes bacterium]|nr:aminotransferase class I/II-fold pyridoxal phosphate-dependent enzyme [Planctomycetota bacterium]
MKTRGIDGFIAKRVAALPTSGIRRFFDIAATMKDVISLGIGEPDFVSPVPVIEAGIGSLKRGETHYTSNQGMLELREAIATQIVRLGGAQYDPRTEIVITVGVSEALYLALMAVTDPGDEVIVPQPSFVSYVPEVVLAGGVPVPVETRAADGWQLRVADLERAVTPRTKAVITSYPNNPTGAVADRATALEIAKLAQKHDLLVISDEIYDRLVYGVEHVCLATLPGLRERTITLGGFSKDYAMTGWRIGYAAAPQPLLFQMNKIHQYTIMSAPTTAQHAAMEALRHGEPHVREMVAEYDRRRRLIFSGLNRLGLACVEPRGAFYAFPSVAATGLDETTFAERLLEEQHVAVVPG